MHETFVGANADDIVKRLKDRAAPQLPFTMRLLIMPMNPISFAQEVVRRYNDEMKAALPIPKSCAEFLWQCVGLNFATIEAALLRPELEPLPKVPRSGPPARPTRRWFGGHRFAVAPK